MSDKLICENIGKTYGKKQVLKDINLVLEHGKIYGLIGRNGAGKTTLLSIMSAQNAPNGGCVKLDDQMVWENVSALEHICFSRELMIMNGSQIGALKVKNYLLAAKTYYSNWDQAYADRLIAEFELDIKQKLAKLSKGMLSMVTIVVALASKAEFTFMDEPVAGLDVIARERFYQLLLEEYMESGRTFVVSTHILEEAAEVFEEVIFLKNGELLLKENTQELVGRCFHVSGLAEKVEEATKNMEVHHRETIGRSLSVDVLLKPWQKLEADADISVQPMSLQKTFAALCGKES